MKKKWLYRLYLLLLSPVLFEVALRLLGGTPFYHVPYSVVSKPKHCLSPDKELGIKLTPGKYEICLNDSVNYQVTHSQGGTRTFEKKQKDNVAYDVAIFGCSYTYGMGIDDPEVMVALMDKNSEQFTFTNYAVPGYGNVQGWIQLKELIATGKKPDIAVFNFVEFHIQRNTLTPSYRSHLKIGFLKAQQEFQEKMQEGYFPYVQLSEKKELNFKKVNWEKIHNNWTGREHSASINFFQSFYERAQLSKLNSDKASQLLFIELNKLCNEYKIQLVVANLVQSPEASDFLSRLQEKGLKVANISLPLNDKKFNNMPYDSHPNALAHKIFAKRTLDYLNKEFLIN